MSAKDKIIKALCARGWKVHRLTGPADYVALRQREACGPCDVWYIVLRPPSGTLGQARGAWVAGARASGWNVAVVSDLSDLVLSGVPGFEWSDVYGDGGNL
jgi:hypothetical protein